MDEQPNVNNLNGVPNWGHGIPEDIPAGDVVVPDAASPTGVDVEPAAEADSSQVEITSQEENK